jgi:hypothetical protein
MLIAVGMALGITVSAQTNLTLVVDGVTYENVRWGTVTPATVTIFHKTGVARIPLEKLSPELQKQFGYDPQRASQYRAAEQRAAQQQAIVNQQRAAERNAKQQEQAAAQETYSYSTVLPSLDEIKSMPVEKRIILAGKWRLLVHA